MISKTSFLGRGSSYSNWNNVISISLRDLYNMSEAAIEDDDALQGPSNSNTGDVGDFSDIITNDRTRCDIVAHIVEDVST